MLTCVLATVAIILADCRKSVAPFLTLDRSFGSFYLHFAVDTAWRISLTRDGLPRHISALCVRPQSKDRQRLRAVKPRPLL